MFFYYKSASFVSKVSYIVDAIRIATVQARSLAILHLSTFTMLLLPVLKVYGADVNQCEYLINNTIQSTQINAKMENEEVFSRACNPWGGGVDNYK